jgi:hypothetical protein
MAHPKRKEFIPYLKEQLGDVDVIWDKVGNCLETRIRCLEHHLESGQEVNLTIQDDSLLTDNFLLKAEEFIKDKDGICNFYYKKGQSEEDLQRAIDRGENFIKSKKLYNEIAFTIPRGHLVRMIEHSKRMLKQGNNKDWTLQDYVYRNSMPVYFSVPSYVDHRVIPSIIRGTARDHRTAMWFSGEWKMKPRTIQLKNSAKTPGRAYKLVDNKIVPK